MTNERNPISPEATSLRVCDWCDETKPAADVLRHDRHPMERDQTPEWVCQDCVEGAHEAAVADYYGGDGPTTARERGEAGR